MALRFAVVNLTCGPTDEEAIVCSNAIATKLLAQYPSLVLQGFAQNSHLSVIHEQNNHLVMLALYENAGVNETEEFILEEQDPTKTYDYIADGMQKRNGVRRKVKYGVTVAKQTASKPTVTKYTGTIPTFEQLRGLVVQ